MDRNEAGILTARKDMDYIGREELLEALKRVSTCLLVSLPPFFRSLDIALFPCKRMIINTLH